MIGRIRERAQLDQLFSNSKSDFVAIYGRRRIGKTYLIREHFKNKMFFQHTGIAEVNMAVQLVNFNRSLETYCKSTECCKDWFEAFFLLQKGIQRSRAKKKVIFIDELPWMDTPRSNFLSALEHFWNNWASQRNDILLIVCGSATSYMVKNIFANKKGLHNRITQKIKLSPFTLKETQNFLQHKQINWSSYQICKIYMAMGGIPFYLDGIQKGQSPDQAIDELFFNPTGLLYNEFHHLYASLFKNANKYIEIIQALASKNKGLTREEIVKNVSTANGGTLTKILNDLEHSHFIRKYVPFGKKYRNSLYQLTDFYSLFYFKFIHKTNIKSGDWIQAIDNPKQRAWSGFAFEQLALAHIEQLKKGLGISGVQTSESSWRSSLLADGAQIDLVMERRDRIIHLFEMKFSINEFTITKKYAEELRNKIGAFQKESKTKSAVWLTLLTTYGLSPNENNNLVQNELKMHTLFLD